MRGKKSPGTTATIVLIRDGYELAVAQVGDSRAILCRGGDARRLTTDHCPSDPGIEKLRFCAPLFPTKSYQNHITSLIEIINGALGDTGTCYYVNYSNMISMHCVSIQAKGRG